MIESLDKTLLLEEAERLTKEILEDRAPRKRRSDAGKKRGPNSKTRSDAGLKRESYNSCMPLMKTYLSVKNKLLKKAPVEGEEPVSQDQNGIFNIIHRHNRTINGNYAIVHRGQAYNRTVKHVKGYTIDLERLRFMAIQDAVYNDFSCQDTIRFKQELESLNLPKNTSFFELFSRLYHIPEEDVLRWSYNEWRQVYDLEFKDGKQIDQDFRFDYRCKPGTEAFREKYVAQLFESAQRDMEELKKTKEYINERARYRASLIACGQVYYKDILLANEAESASWSMKKLTTEVNKLIDYDVIGQEVERYMLDWLEKKITNN
jgi:hypothetical protein